jgi:hypothetical protein
MIAQQNGPVVPVGHCHGGAAIMKAGDRPDFVGLVYIAAFGPDAGKSLLAARFG